MEYSIKVMVFNNVIKTLAKKKFI